MVHRFLVAAAIVAGLCVPAFSATAPVPSGGGTSTTTTTTTSGTTGTNKPAATPKVWYVAQNDKTMNCIVTPSKPNGTTYMMIGMMTYPTVAAATTAMHAAMECKPVVKAKT